MNKLTVEWVKKAEDDLAAAQKLAAGRAKFHDQVCFHAQQSADKYLKALLQELGIVFPRTHDILLLVDLLIPHDKSLRRLRRGAKTLTRYAVDYRYPGLTTNARQARRALARATVFQDEIRKRLGLGKP
jgi:HEPN domain-containing protein